MDAEYIAKETGLALFFIEPGYKERAQLGIGSVQEEQAEQFARRERYWLDRIAEHDFSIALCVLGAAHIATFPTLLSSQYDVEIAASFYDPNGLMKK